jgi:cellulose synthase (UDP-forming)
MTNVITPDVFAPTSPAAVAPRVAHIAPPDDQEMWSYVAGDGKRFLQFSALSRMFLGGALVFLALRGDWLLLLLPFGVGIVLGGLINLVWSTQIQPFDREAHRQRVAAATTAAASTGRWSVDVFICTCGEDPAIVENTIMHATALQHAGPINVFVLDDRGIDAVRDAAALWGAQYVARPDRGWMKKAGNLRHGYEQSSGDMIIVLDADFAVRPDFLTQTLPYFDDPALGILQTPQFFRTSRDNWVERGAAAQQEQFYRIGLRARDRRNGAICVGTNAVYRRSALDERGGMALLEHSEDIFTGMKVVDAGYRVDYLPLPLASGSTPDNTAALASQQYRWARGNFALAGTPLFKRMTLSPMQRLGLWDGWIFYVTSALSPLVALFVPIVSLAEAPEAITLAPAAMVLPALFTEFYLQPKWLHLSDGRASRRVGLISQAAHLYALRDHLTDRDQEWIPTGGARPSDRKHGTDRIPDQIATGAMWGFTITMLLLGVRVATGWSIVDLAPVGVLAALALPAALGTTRPAVTVHRDPDAPAADAGRDPFLDVVRAASIVRVIFWHALGFWWISWTFAAMPAVFYVSGAVLAKSMRKSSCWTVVKGRLRRLVPPYLAFVCIGMAGVLLAAPEVLADSTSSVVSWFVPYRAPAPLAWEEGWLSTPLWFLRALVIVLLLTPLVRPIGQRLAGWLMFCCWLGSLFALDWWVNQQTTEMATGIVRGVADIVCFGGFFALGVSAHHLRYKLSRSWRWRLAVLFGAGGVAAALVSPPIDRVVNNSYVLLGLVGLAWLLVMLAMEDQMRHLGTLPALKRFVGWITDGSMSIYLWHTLALVFAYYVVGAPTSPGQYVILAAVFVVVLVSVVAAVRPLESLFAGDRSGVPRLRLLPIAMLVAGLAVVVTQPTLFPRSSEVFGPPTPSGRPPFGVDGDRTGAGAGAVGAGAGAVGDGGSTEVDAAEMARNGDAWLKGHGVAGAAVIEIGATTGEDPVLVTYGDAVGDATPATPTTPTTSTVGDVAALDPNEQFEALSLTKTMVAAVALQLVDEGVLTLDGPLPHIEGIASDVTDTLTLRRLLSHSTGLKDYRENTNYRPDMILTPVDAVNLAISQSDLTSNETSYAAPNFLLAGLAIESVTETPLSEVLQERIFTPFGLDDTEMVNNTREGFVGHGSGGVVSTLGDMAHWYDQLMRQHSVLSDEMFDEMVWGGNVYQKNAGLGSWRHCPCDPPSEEVPEPYLYTFHDGGDVRLVYIPSRDVVLAMRFSKPLYDEDQIVGDIDDFVFAVADRRGPPVVD